MPFYRLPLLVVCLLCITALAQEEPTEPPVATIAQDAPAPAANDSAAAQAESIADAGRAPQLSIAAALEGILDMDEPTRQAAYDRLKAVTADDLPALEEYVNDPNPEIRRQARLLAKQLKRGVFAIVLHFPDGKPAADLPVRVEVYEGQVQNLNTRGAPVIRQGNNVLAAKEQIDAELKTDAAGRLDIGAWNDGDYTYRVEVDTPLPRQTLTGTHALSQNAKPLALTVRHGAEIKVAVQDEKEQPAAQVIVYCFEDDNTLNMLDRIAPSQLLNYLRRHPQAETDAAGVATFHALAPRGQIHLVAVKPGCAPAVEKALAVKDGGSVSAALALKPLTPVKITCQLTVGANQPTAQLRVLLVRQDQLAQALGGRWAIDLDIDKFDDYVKAGAVDLGNADADGKIAVTLLPDSYRVVGYAKDGNKYYHGLLTISATAADKEVPVRLNPLNIRRK